MHKISFGSNIETSCSAILETSNQNILKLKLDINAKDEICGGKLESSKPLNEKIILNCLEDILEKKISDDIYHIDSNEHDIFYLNILIEMCINDYIGHDFGIINRQTNKLSKMICPCYSITINESEKLKDFAGSACGKCLTDVNLLAKKAINF